MSNLDDIIRAEIRARGGITFARFMELALYCPLYGYYEQEKDSIGKRGDYYTSVSVGSLFGELLAFQFAKWLPLLADSPAAVHHGAETSNPVQIVEAGAHDGRLAADILVWLRRQRPTLFERLEYWIVEPSQRRREWQRETLREFSQKLQWLDSFPPDRKHGSPGVRGVIFSNELLDAMPLHRLGWDACKRRWFEWGVSLQGDALAWQRMNLSADFERNQWPFNIAGDILDHLPDNFTTEICPAAVRWWRQAARNLEAGRLMTIDYGATSDELLQLDHRQGTVRAFHEHRVSENPLANPGEQDITAHVNFSSLQQAGAAEGLRAETFETQEQFLTRIAARAWSAPSLFGEWTAKQTRQFQTLTHPQHLGRSFRVLVENRST